MGKASRRKEKAGVPTVLEHAKSILQKMGGAKDIRIRDTLPQEEKISHALSLLLESEVLQGSPLEEYKAALFFIVIAWNISLLDVDTRADELRKFVDTLDGAKDSMRRELASQIEQLIARKEVLFPDDRRTIVSWDVRFQGDKVLISAAALAQD